MPSSNPSDWLEIDPEIADALSSGAPVVALESTIITHGMPYPQNLETALAVETAVRAENAMPATIVVMDGKIRCGVRQPTLEMLAKARDVAKLSRADLAFALATGQTGSTTVAATMMAAHLAGIEIFATGGIGGVHRGADRNFDISADLHELARTPVLTVCAGAKAILDIPATLEVLETLGVAVIGFNTDAFPAFWSPDSGLPCPLRMDTPRQIARYWQTRKAIGQDGAALIANPVAGKDAIDRDSIEKLVEAAQREANQIGISGKDVTPWMLAKILEATEGRSLQTNIALILGNAALAGKIAHELAGM